MAPVTIEELRQLSAKDPKLSKVTKENLVDLLLKADDNENNGINLKLDNIASEIKSMRDDNSKIILELREEVKTLKTEIDNGKQEIQVLRNEIVKQNTVITAHQRAWEELDARER